MSEEFEDYSGVMGSAGGPLADWTNGLSATIPTAHEAGVWESFGMLGKIANLTKSVRSFGCGHGVVEDPTVMSGKQVEDPDFRNFVHSSESKLQAADGGAQQRVEGRALAQAQQTTHRPGLPRSAARAVRH